MSEIEKYGVAFLSFIAVVLLAGCPEAARESGDTSGDAEVVGAAQTEKLEIPNKVKKRLDFPAEYTITELDETRTTVYLVYVVNPPRTEEIAQMIIADLETRGYGSGDNPSRILEGVTFTGGELREVYVKVTEEYGKGTIVTLDIKI
jgi:hypothetical protein